MNRLTARLEDTRRAFAANARNPPLGRAQLSFGYAFAAEWAVTVALGVVAYRAGSAAAVRLVAFLRMVPAAPAGAAWRCGLRPLPARPGAGRCRGGAHGLDRRWLFVLERRHFVPTVTGYRASVAEAGAQVSAHLARDATAAAPAER